MSQSTETILGDEILLWRIVDPGDIVEGFPGPLFSTSMTYLVAVVPADKPKHPDFAIQHGTLGKIPNLDRTETTIRFRDVVPMQAYHLGYKENEFWHWVTFVIPMKLRPMYCTDKTVCVHVDFDQLESVIAIRTLITSPSNNGAHRVDRIYDLGDLPIDETTELQAITFRNLMPCCAYFIQAWPVFSDGTFGEPTMRKRVVTQAEVVVFLEEIGDTYLRLAFRRPPLRQPLHTDVREVDAQVDEYVLRVWEDPTDSLIANAQRLSRGRQPQRYPLRKSEVCGKNLPCGITQIVVVDRLKPNAAHFITLESKGPGAEFWDPRVVRVRVRTAPELVFPSVPPSISTTCAEFHWHLESAQPLSYFNLDVDYPKQVNNFNDREVLKPYLGSKVIELPDGKTWAPPAMPTEISKARSPSFEVSIHDTLTGQTRLIRVDNEPRALLSELKPSTLYMIKVRTTSPPLPNSRGSIPSPWSRPYLFMTPSDILCREIHRTRSTLTLAWGRHLPNVMMPLDHEPGHFKYLPDINSTEPNAGYYYYLEPLPFLCGEAVDKAVLSDSEDEEEVYADGCVTGSGSGYLGKRSRIFNRTPRPEPTPFPCSLEMREYVAIEMLLLTKAPKAVSGTAPEIGFPVDPEATLPSTEASDALADEGWAQPAAFLAPRQKEKEPDMSEVTAEINKVVRLFEKNVYGEKRVAEHIEELISTKLHGKLRILERYTEEGCEGMNTFHDLPNAMDVIVLFFATRASTGCQELLQKFTLHTIDDGAVGCPFPASIPRTLYASQALWSVHLCDSSLQSDRQAHIALEELSEVFVTLRIGLCDAVECNKSLQLSMLNDNALEFVATEQAAQSDDDEPVTAGSDGCRSLDIVPHEFLINVEQVEVVDGSRTVIGTPKCVYMCTSEEVVQLVDLTAASRYEVSIATMNPKTHAWTNFSEPVSFTTVQKLLFELEEISSEYINLKWGRSRLDRISEFVLQISDVTLSTHLKEIASESLKDSTLGRSLLTAHNKHPELAASAQFVEGSSDKLTIVTTATHHRLDTMTDLRANALFDCTVLPQYVNGQRGLYSNILRFLHCTLKGTVVEAGVAHLRIEWAEPRLLDLTPKCGNANSSDESIVSVCLIRLRDSERTWERTVTCSPSQGYFTFEGLKPQTAYDAHITLVALLPRCNCCVPEDPATLIECAAPFATHGETLGQPRARVVRVWEDSVELEWLFEAEPTHVGDVEIELRFSDRKHAEMRDTILRSPAQGKEGSGRHIVSNLNAGRIYGASIRQKYSRGTWGEWQNVINQVRTLPKLQLRLAAASESSFRFCAFRDPMDTANIPGMENAIQVHPVHYKYRIEKLCAPKSSQPDSTPAVSPQTAAESAVDSNGVVDSEKHVSDEIDAAMGFMKKEPNADNAVEEEQEDPSRVSYLEAYEIEALIPGLEPNTPYKITAQQFSLDAFGDASNPVHSFTLNNLLPAVTRRCDSYFELHCSRDRRLPKISSSLCTPHNESSTVSLSRLIGIHFIVTSLLNGLEAGRYFVNCTEAECPTTVCSIPDLEACHPYRIDTRPEYEGKEYCPHLTSLATMTANIPNLFVASLGEDCVTLKVDNRGVPKQMAQSLDVFQTLPSNVRHAAHEGGVASIIRYQFVFAGIIFDNLDEGEERPQVFQSGADSEECTIPSTSLAVSKGGMAPETSYNVSLRTVDDRGYTGKTHLIGAIVTRSFPKIVVNKLSENFAEIAWNDFEEEIGEDHTVSTVSGHIMKRFGNYSKIPPAVGYDAKNNGNAGDVFEFIIAEDLEVPDLSRPATRTAGIEYTKRSTLVEQLIPETQYFVIGRCLRQVPDAEGNLYTVASAWGPSTRFATLALLVLRVIHCSLDFANIAWQDPVTTSPVKRLSVEHGAGNLPENLNGSTTTFIKQILKSSATDGQLVFAGSAQPVRFQLRLMHATEDGRCGQVIEDMFVVTTEDGIHTIGHLTPGTNYAVSMRVCYEGLSGSWVAPALFRTDKIPDPRYVAITRRDIDIELEVALGGELRDDDEHRVPDRIHRLYEVLLNDSDYIRFVLHKVHNPSRLFIGGLVRGRRYHAAVREVINGVRYGSFVHLCSFWIQPYPPIILRLLECRDGFCEMEWTVIEKKSEKEKEDEEDVGFVYQLEQGIRTSNPTVGERWEEVVTTEVPSHRFKWTEKAPAGSTFPKLCFRVRASKCFALQNGLAFKTPVWGDWSTLAYWNEAEPPLPVTHLSVVYCSNDCAIATWDLPFKWEFHPNLKFTVKVRFIPAPTAGQDDPSEVDATDPSWYTVGTTALQAIEIPKLAKATTYHIAVQSESSLGINSKATVVSFTTRSIPNVLPKPAVEDVAPKVIVPEKFKRLLLPGLRPVDPFQDFVANLHDKYEEPKKLRMRALARMAGMLDKTRREKFVQRKFQGLIRRIIAIQKVVHRFAADFMMNSRFSPNEVYSPEQVARLRFGLDPEGNIVTWTKEVEDFLGSDENSTLRKQFSFHPNAQLSLKLPREKRARRKLGDQLAIQHSVSPHREIEADTAKSIRSDRSIPSPSHSITNEGVSWTADKVVSKGKASRTSSAGGKSLSSHSEEALSPPRQHSAPSKGSKAIQPPTLSVTDRSQDSTPTERRSSEASPAAAAGAKTAQGKKSSNAVKLPSIAGATNSIPLSPRYDDFRSKSLKSGSVAEDASKQLSTNVDPPPLLPPLLRRQFIAAAIKEAHHGNGKKL